MRSARDLKDELSRKHDERRDLGHEISKLARALRLAQEDENEANAWNEVNHVRVSLTAIGERLGVSASRAEGDSRC